MTNTINDELAAASNNPLIPHIYLNSFGGACGAVDVTILLKRNDVPVATLNLSYGCAKSLRDMLHALVDGFEKTTGSNAITHNDFHTAVGKESGIEPGSPTRQ